MKVFKRCLVVGADGIIGGRLTSVAYRIADHVIGSTRRSGNEAMVHLDLAAGEFDAALRCEPDVAFLCAAITSIDMCDAEPVRSRRINVDETAKLAKALLERGCFVVFLSSNTVFDGQQLWPDEDAPYSPNTEYGRQKVAAEQALLGLPRARERLAIVRLSKVLLTDRGVVGNVLTQLSKGEPCRVFADLNLSPVSLTYVAESLLRIAEQRCAGVSHLSGMEELSYAELAVRLATWLGADSSLVQPTDSATASVPVLFRPRHPGLGMKITRQRLGIAPEPLEEIFNALMQSDGVPNER